ncbi:MAG: hypothetical protein M3156_02655 [Thermoproteota archaeon]|nr:hypothetical protein [Thermoproteota archaeon]
MSQKEIYTIGLLVAFAFAGIFAVQAAAGQSIPDNDFAESDIDIPIPDVQLPVPSGDASNPQINSNTVMNLIP